MDRIQIAAVALAIGMILLGIQLGGSATSQPAGPSRDGSKATEVVGAKQSADVPSTPGTAASPVVEPAVVRELVASELENPSVRIGVSNENGMLSSVQLLAFPDRTGSQAGPVELVTTPDQGVLITSFGAARPALNDPGLRWEVARSSARSVLHRAQAGGVEVERELTLDERGYGGVLRVSVRNASNAPVSARVDVALPARERPVGAPDALPNYNVSALVGGDLERLLVSGLEVGGFFSGPSRVKETFPSTVDWVGLESQYFMLSVGADHPRDFGATWESLGAQQGRVVLEYPGEGKSVDLPPGERVERTYRLYFGPKVEAEAVAVDKRLAPSLHVGWQWISPLVDLFAFTLRWLNDQVVGNYGLAIIVITILLRLLTYPLTQSSMKSMKRLSLVGPQMRAIQEKYKADAPRMQQEIMGLYRKTGINPLSAMAGGCLPMLLQMPFMVALYFALQGSIELRHAPFMLWIDDLSVPEHLGAVLGIPIRPLPILMGGSMILQQYLTPQTGDPQQAQQRQMMMVMSGVFVVMFYQFPAGLVLYWLISNLLGIGQQILVNRQPATA